MLKHSLLLLINQIKFIKITQGVLSASGCLEFPSGLSKGGTDDKICEIYAFKMLEACYM